MLKHSTVDMKLSARRLSGVNFDFTKRNGIYNCFLCSHLQLWKGNSDFLKANTMKSVQLQLNSMEKMLKKEQVDKDKIKQVKKSGREFFMELVSELCFGGRAAPEPDLVKILLDTVFVEKSDSTQELTPYKDDKADKIPTIRSFLLQLLLEHRYVLVWHGCFSGLLCNTLCMQHGSSKRSPERLPGQIVSCSVRKTSYY